MKKHGLLAIALLLANALAAQILNEPQALESALKNWPTLKIAAAEIQKRQALERTAINLPQPEITVESPTGLFYTPGISQSFGLPNAYSRRKKLLRAETELARRAAVSTENELRKAVRLAFLEMQTAQAKADLAPSRDSILQKLAAAATRLFDGGQINFVEKKQAETRAAAAQNDLASSRADLEIALENLRFFTGETAFSTVEILKKKEPPAENGNLAANPEIRILEQNAAVKLAEKAAQKTADQPEIMLGYMNQGEKTSLIGYRFRAGLTLPIWRGQFRGANEAARIDSEKAATELDFAKKSLARQLENHFFEQRKQAAQLAFFETTALPDATAIIAASTKLFEGGETDLAEHLRMLADAFSVRADYLEALRNQHETAIEIDFLNGK